MPRTGWTPRIVPYGADQTAYLVIDRFRGNTVYRETEVERTDLETIIADLISGQFNDPVRIVAFKSIGPRTSRNISPSKFKPAAISKAPPCRSTPGTSLPASSVRLASWPFGSFDIAWTLPSLSALVVWVVIYFV